MILWCYDISIWIYIFSHTATGKASAASVYNFPLHSYLRSILTAEMPRSFFIALNYELREICLGIMVLVFEYISLTQRLGKRAQRACITSPSILTYGPFLRRGCPGPFYLFELWTPRDLSWYYGIMVLWCYDIMVLWCYDIMVLWCYDIMVLWCYDIMVLWYYGVSIWIYILSHSDWRKRAQRACIHPPSSYGGRSARYWARASILTYGPFLRRGCPVIFIALNYELREICRIDVW